MANRKRNVPGTATYEMIDDAGDVHLVRHDWVSEQIKDVSGYWVNVNPRREWHTLVEDRRKLTEVSEGVLLDKLTGMKLRRKPK